MRKTIFSFLVLLVGVAFGQIPSGYYNSATGTGYTLKTQLHNIIDDHTTRSYGDLWDFYADYELDTYYENDGTILDMYSERPTSSDPYNFTKVTDQCGNYSGEGSCYNREHSFPKSWFNDASPMYSDVVHIVASDGYVNGQRGSFPFGEVGTASWTSQNGSKKGSGRSELGYTGTVFEPIDEFKGDFARIYFYMATRYEDVISGWSSPMLDGSSNQVYEDWAVDMLMDWHANDPVSQKEIDRNNAAYSFQGNRNPFVDHPEWVNAIWGDGTVNPTPTISTTANGGGYSFGNVPAGLSSTSASYKVTGSNLEGNVTVSTSAPFQVSLNNSVWSTSVVLTEANAEANTNNTIYVRFSPTVENGQTYNGTISHTSTNATTVNVSVSGTEQTVSISTIAEARALGIGAEVTIQGTVSTPDMGNTSGNFYVQDETGGILIYHEDNHGLVDVGDQVEITGVRANYNDILEIEPTSVTVLSSGSRPTPVDIASSDLTVNNARQGMLVRLSGVLLNDTGQWPTVITSATEVAATASGTPFAIRLHPTSYYNGSPAPTSDDLTVTGVLTRFEDQVQIMPFVNGDVVATAELPELSSSDASLTFGEVAIGENSAAQAVVVTGSNLTENVTVTSTGDFRVANTAGGTYSTNLSLSPSSGTVNTTLYVRFSPTVAGTGEGTVTLASSGEEQLINLSGTGTSDADISLDTTPFNGDFGDVATGSLSASSSYLVAATGLTGNLQITAPDYFRVSLLPTSGYGSSLQLASNNGTVNSTTIYVVFAPGVAGAQSGNIVHAADGLSVNVPVQGSGMILTSAEPEAEIEIYPNPTEGSVDVKGVDWKTTTVRIFDNHGYRLPVRFKEGRIDVSDFPAGMYYFTFSGPGEPVVRKVVIR